MYRGKLYIYIYRHNLFKKESLVTKDLGSRPDRSQGDGRTSNSCAVLELALNGTLF